MATIVTQINQPNLTNAGNLQGTISDPNRWYDYKTLWASLNNATAGDGNEKQAVFYLPYAVNQRVPVVILDDPTDATIEVSADAQQTIYDSLNPPADDAENIAPTDSGNPIWGTLPGTVVAVNPLAFTCTAVRVTNTGSGTLNIRIAV